MAHVSLQGSDCSEGCSKIGPEFACATDTDTRTPTYGGGAVYGQLSQQNSRRRCGQMPRSRPNGRSPQIPPHAKHRVNLRSRSYIRDTERSWELIYRGTCIWSLNWGFAARLHLVAAYLPHRSRNTLAFQVVVIDVRRVPLAISPLVKGGRALQQPPAHRGE
jgi:hypothetical protein